MTPTAHLTESERDLLAKATTALNSTGPCYPAEWDPSPAAIIELLSQLAEAREVIATMRKTIIPPIESPSVGSDCTTTTAWWKSLFGGRQETNVLVRTTWEKQGVADNAYPSEFAVKIAEISQDKRVYDEDRKNYACSVCYE